MVGMFCISGSESVIADDDGDTSREASPCEEHSENYNVGNVAHQANVPSVSRSPMNKVTVATQTGQEAPDLVFNPDKMTTDKHCYECKVRYRDPKPRDLVMYLHAWKYKVSISQYISKPY
jgi:hypothetical protein